MKSVLKLVTAAIAAGSPSTLSATGFRLPDQDAFATARGEAFAATADNPSAIYYNPAGIVQLSGNHARVGIYGIYLAPSYEPPAPGTGTFHNQSTLHAIPQLFFTHSRENSPLSFGFGVYSPFGLGLRWPQDTGFRTVGTESKLAYITANPVVALKLGPAFSVGGGITVNHSEADLRQGFFSPTQPTDEFRFRGSGWDVGYNLGALWKPHEKISIGVSFRSKTEINLKGHTHTHNDAAPLPVFSERIGAQAEFPFPLIAIFGISYRPSPSWNFEFNADYASWNDLKTVVIRQDSPPAVLPQNIPVVLEWESSWYYEFGATRYLDNGWHVSAGYIFNENSVPDAHYTPLVADMDRHFFSVGTGVKGKRLDFDIAYQFGYGPTRTVTGSAPSATGQTADGRYTFISHAISVSAGINF